MATQAETQAFYLFIGTSPETFIEHYKQYKKSNLTANLSVACYNCNRQIYGPKAEQKMTYSGWLCSKCMDELYQEAINLI